MQMHSMHRHIVKSHICVDFSFFFFLSFPVKFTKKGCPLVYRLTPSLIQKQMKTHTRKPNTIWKTHIECWSTALNNANNHLYWRDPD